MTGGWEGADGRMAYSPFRGLRLATGSGIQGMKWGEFLAFSELTSVKVKTGSRRVTDWAGGFRRTSPLFFSRGEGAPKIPQGKFQRIVENQKKRIAGKRIARRTGCVIAAGFKWIVIWVGAGKVVARASGSSFLEGFPRWRKKKSGWTMDWSQPDSTPPWAYDGGRTCLAEWGRASIPTLGSQRGDLVDVARGDVCRIGRPRRGTLARFADSVGGNGV